MHTRDFPLEVKALKDQGKFEGYASVFGNVDQGGDIIEEGAFKEFARTRDNKTLILFQHDMRQPIGKAEVSQDSKGLHVKGELVMADPVAQRAYVHMKADTLDGMSVGFDILPGGAEILNSGVRTLKALKLWEVSLVTFGMNELARVESVKRAGQMTTIREYEDFLRDEAGYSHAQAKLLASGGWKALQMARDEPASGAGAEQLRKTIEAIAAIPVAIQA
jgi:HK97 family phage prohead protease